MLKMESGPSLFSDSKTSDDLLNQASVKALQATLLRLRKGHRQVF